LKGLQAPLPKRFTLTQQERAHRLQLPFILSEVESHRFDYNDDTHVMKREREREKKKQLACEPVKRAVCFWLFSETVWCLVFLKVSPPLPHDCYALLPPSLGPTPVYRGITSSLTLEIFYNILFPVFVKLNLRNILSTVYKKKQSESYLFYIFLVCTFFFSSGMMSLIVCKLWSSPLSSLDSFLVIWKIKSSSNYDHKYLITMKD